MQARALTLALLLSALPLTAQQIDDPANLMGERVSAPALADTLPINHGAPALEQLLRKLRTRASMMMIVAHPDDEDSGLLTLESRGMGARVAMLTLTRGEGGQNLMSADFNDALGLIRTQELLAEDRYTGTDQFFGTEVDFGFSKTKEESLQQWTHNRVLYDAVRAVRLYRPLVLASVFIGGVTDGHGQHQVSGEICQEVFLAAADPKVFPDMGLPPWAPLRVYARVPFSPITGQGMYDYATGTWSPPHFHNYVTGKDTTTPPEATLIIHEGDKPDIAAFNGQSYVQWARQGLALQKTQIGATVRIPPPGRNDIGYTLMASRIHCTPTIPGASCLDPEAWATANSTAPAPGTRQALSHANQQTGKDGAFTPGAIPRDGDGLFSGIDTSIPGIASLAPDASPGIRNTLRTIDARFEQAQHVFNPAHPESTAQPLRDALHLLDGLITTIEQSSLNASEKFNMLHEVRVKAAQTNQALVLALSVSIRAETHLVRDSDGRPRPAIAALGDSSVGDRVDFQSTLSSPFKSQLVFTSSGAMALQPAKSHLPAEDSLYLSSPAPRGRTQESCPYFDRSNDRSAVYNVSANALRNAPAKPAFTSNVRLGFGNVSLTTAAVIQNGEEALRAVPSLNVFLPSHVGIFKPSDTSFPVTVSLSTDSPKGLNGTINLDLPEGWTSTPTSFPFAFDKGKPSAPRAERDPDASSFTFLVKPAHISAETSYPIKASARIGLTDFTRGYRQVGYPGLTSSDYCTPATYTATAVDVTTAPNLQIAYLPGTGDDVPAFLPALGVVPTILTPRDLASASLKQYDAILLGVRAYSAHPELSGSGSDPLTAYVKAGGVVIAQYNSAGFNPASAPFPYTLPGDSAHNVVVETQPMTILAQKAPLLTWPNKLNPADFTGWTEEWGHGFASNWAPEYQALLEVHDPGQDPQRGGLLVAPVGRGAYIYCALALYRQLPEGVPGAYRLLANLLSYAKNPERTRLQQP